MKTYTTIRPALSAVQPGERLIRIRLPTDCLYVIIPELYAGEAKLDCLTNKGRCDGPEIII